MKRKNYFMTELSYIFALKGVKVQMKEGKGVAVFRTPQEKEKFRVIKGLHALSALTFSESQGRSRLLSSRRSVWRCEVFYDPYEWIDYYLTFFDSYLKEKGLQMRSFCTLEGWFFLLKGVGELRFARLKYDYYQWHSTLRFLVPLKLKKKDRRVFFSGLKIHYK